MTEERWVYVVETHAMFGGVPEICRRLVVSDDERNHVRVYHQLYPRGEQVGRGLVFDTQEAAVAAALEMVKKRRACLRRELKKLEAMLAGTAAVRVKEPGGVLKPRGKKARET